MKIIKETRKYYHTRILKEDYEYLQKCLIKKEREERQQKELEAKAKKFFTEHEEVSWEDEYSSWHTCWKNKKTRKTVPSPDIFMMTYKHKYYKVKKT